MRTHDYFPCTAKKAAYAKWLVKVSGWSLTKTAITLALNCGTVSKVVNGHRFADVPALPPPFLNNDIDTND